MVVFLPVLQNGFVNWDDPVNFLNNPHYRGGDLEVLARAGRRGGGELSRCPPVG